MSKIFSWLGLGLVLIAMAAAGCRFMPNEPYWIEGFGRGRAVHISAWPLGALAIGPDAILYTYPGTWAQPWIGQSSPALKGIAASHSYVYGLHTDGQLSRRTGGGHWQPVPGSAAWNASVLSVTEDDRVWVVADGALRAVEGNQLRQTVCASLAVAWVAAVRGDAAFLLDQSGGLHRASGGRCERIETPVALQHIAATTGRLLAVSVDGAIWRRRDGGAWTKLPAPIKYRPGRRGFATQAREVAVSAHSSWILDHEGSIFVLSEET
jgi:hypothetical protein